ncbi:cysteine-rich protein 2-binding protein-like [Tropilaelaps mercedesae]|uniref:Cysteine-rich protein 2-binding protein-like n=1 Tax=Tropilaelaps mercedesae TaxID=418985 RepID=A0A1V9XVZ2_9ACAR|nr:cysteine-rich protein 2-binding protein-like [Tropilaelaps mercedesae]
MEADDSIKEEENPDTGDILVSTVYDILEATQTGARNSDSEVQGTVVHKESEKNLRGSSADVEWVLSIRTENPDDEKQGNSAVHNTYKTRSDAVAPAILSPTSLVRSSNQRSSLASPLHCYCKTATVDPLMMVICEGCGLYFHQNCFHKGRFSTLLGDKFIEFYCESCGSSQDLHSDSQKVNSQKPESGIESPSLVSRERITRKPHTWVTAVALALFNLHMTCSHESRKGYFQWREQVCRYIEERWNEFFFDRKKAPKWQGAVACTLSTNTGVLFQSGVTEIDEQGWWKLIVNVPPDPKNPIPHRGSGRRRRVPGDEAHLTAVELGPRIRKRPALDGHVLHTTTASTSREAFSRRGLENSNTGKMLGRRSLEIAGSRSVSRVEKLERPPTFDDIAMKQSGSKLEPICRSLSEVRKSTAMTFRNGNSSWQGLNDPSAVGHEKQIAVSAKPMSLKSENHLLESLKALVVRGIKLERNELRLLNKLRVRQIKRKKGLPLFDLDKEVARLLVRPSTQSKSDSMHEMLDQFVHTNVISTTSVQTDGDNIRDVSFATKLLGSKAANSSLSGFRSPYTQRLLKPYIFRDLKPDYPRIKLMQEIHSYVLSTERHTPCSNGVGYEVLPVDLVYIRPQHVAVINSICRSFFWAGIDLTGQLVYPEFSVVALYGKLVIGFACMAPLANCNEAYLSFLWTHPHFRRRGLARCMLYHLSQSCMGRDIVLHVAITNPAVFLYQSFKFKVEKLCLNFYDKYLPMPPARKCVHNINPQTSKENRHALYMRLKW